MKKIPTPEVEAKAGLYVNEKGEHYHPGEAFRSAIIGKGGSASGRRIGKRSAISVMSAAFFVMTEKPVLVHPKTGKPLREYEVDTRRAVVQGQGVQRSRPKFLEWALVIQCEVDEDFVTVKQVLELLKIAGKISGVGDYRIQKKGPFGRFDAELLE